MSTSAILASLHEQVATLKADADRLDWLQKVHSLHKSVEFLYVVDGYQCSLIHDADEVATFLGENLRDALDQAREAQPDPGRYWSSK